MQTIRSRARVGGFSLIELLCVVAVIAVLAGLLLPALSQGRVRASRAACVNNLRETGLGFQAFAHDHNSQFPMAVSTNAGGASEFVENAYHIKGEFYFCSRLLQPLSNELVTPKVLVCPADTRSAAVAFAALQNANLSYFVGVTADYSQPNSILAGDRNVTNDLTGSASILRLGPGQRLRWTEELHRFKGNLLYADGRVEQQNTTALAAANNQGQAADIFVPSVPASDDVASASASGAPAGAASAWNPPPLPGQPGTSAAKTNTPPDQPTTNTALPAKPAHPWSPAVASPPAALAGSPGSGANSSSTKPSPITSPIATQATNTAKAETRPKTPSLTTPVTEPRIAAGVAAASGLKIPATEEPGTGLHWPFYLLLLVLLLGVLAMCLAAWAKRKQLS